MRSKVGMLFQESALFDSMTIEQNVAYPLLNQTAIDRCNRRARMRSQRCEDQALRFVELGQTTGQTEVSRASSPAVCGGAPPSPARW